MLLQLIRNQFLEIVNNIDAGNSNICEADQEELLNLIQRIMDKELSKTESANYIGVCPSTFNNYINRGLIPKGHKRQGLGKTWLKSDLDNYLKNKK